MFEMENGDIEIALTGETLICRKLSVFREPQFLSLIEMLRKADVTFTNLECIIQDFEDSPNTFAGGGAPGGTYMVTPPELVDELKWAGFNLFSTANNHSFDFGEAGILSSLRFLKAAGLAHAGIGRNMTEASAPVYFDTPKGRVAMIAAADWGPRGAGDIPWPVPMGVIAGEQSPASRGRPGINLVRCKSEVTVDRETFDALTRASEKLGWISARDSRRKGSVGFDRPATSARFGEETDTQNEIHFMGTRFMLGEPMGVTMVAEREDIERNLKWIRDARRMASWVIYSFHNHGGGGHPHVAPAYSIKFAHECIDNGADLYVGHGTGQERGIEIYKGKAIFHGLGCFMLQNEQVPWVPYDLMARFGLGHENTPSDFYDARSGHGTRGSAVSPERWRGVVPILKYSKGQLRTIQLHPIDLGPQLPRHERGRPLLADEGSDAFKAIIAHFQKVSSPFGTKISDDGLIKVDG